jgi:hypothetical protein
MFKFPPCMPDDGMPAKCHDLMQQRQEREKGRKEKKRRKEQAREKEE